jgi:hypothetical protein
LVEHGENCDYVFQTDGLEDVGDVLATVGGGLQDLVYVEPFNDIEREVPLEKSLRLL